MKSIPLINGGNALVDDEDYDLLSEERWRSITIHGVTYATRHEVLCGFRYWVYMHRVILNSDTKESVDHKDGNGLNNQKSNLRLCPEKFNRRNSKLRSDSTIGFKGVALDKRDGVFSARIGINRQHIHLGRFRDAVSAAIAYDAAAIKHFGEFARTNASMGIL